MFPMITAISDYFSQFCCFCLVFVPFLLYLQRAYNRLIHNILTSETIRKHNEGNGKKEKRNQGERTRPDPGESPWRRDNQSLSRHVSQG